LSEYSISGVDLEKCLKVSLPFKRPEDLLKRETILMEVTDLHEPKYFSR